MSLARGGEIPQALANILGQVTLGLLAFWAAWALVQATLGGRS
jgi:fluoride ion exporter CrcB/FEX